MINQTSQAWIDVFASRQSQKILTGTLCAVERYKFDSINKESECAIIFYEDAKIIIPISEMNIAREERTIVRSMIGADIDFIVYGIDKENNFAVGSRKAAMKKRRELELKKHKVGNTIQVRVTSVGKNWIYVEAYGIETTIKKEDIAYGYVDDINQLVQVGDRTSAVIKSLDIENNLIELSIKDTKADPFMGIENKYRVKGEYLATLTGIKEFGVFLELEQGIYVLCNHPHWIGYNATIGDKMLVQIVKIRQNERKIDGKLIRVIKRAI
jgi:small subunit ribosomal protein S1